MGPTYLGITNPLVYALPAFVLLICIELYLSVKHDRHIYYWKDLAASVSVGLGAGTLAVFTKAASLLMFFFFFELFKPLRVSWFGYEHFGWAWYIWLICQLADDFTYYWYHRLSHEVRVLWAAHLVHHSSEKFNFGTGVRNGWFTLFYKPMFWIWMAVIGFHPFMMATCLGIQAIYQFHLHTKSVPNLGFLEKFMNTPTQHQVHHSKNHAYLDKNHGGFLNIFDRLFGTFLDLDRNNKADFGILKPPESYNPIVIVTHEYKNIWDDVKSAKNWKERFMYVFGPPGWSPDGSTMTVKELQAQLQKAS